MLKPMFLLSIWAAGLLLTLMIPAAVFVGGLAGYSVANEYLRAFISREWAATGAVTLWTPIFVAALLAAIGLAFAIMTRVGIMTKEDFS